jgi:radical SAM superfamily enzyme
LTGTSFSNFYLNSTSTYQEKSDYLEGFSNCLVHEDIVELYSVATPYLLVFRCYS